MTRGRAFRRRAGNEQRKVMQFIGTIVVAPKLGLLMRGFDNEPWR